jgi:Flp pilus assembly protein TadG
MHGPRSVRSPDRGPITGAAGRRSTDWGAAAIEMAIVLPLLLLILFAIIDFGRLLNKQISLTEAARDGARVASFGGDPTNRVKTIAGNDVSVATVSCPSPPTPDSDAQVTVTNNFQFVTPLIAFLGGGGSGTMTLTGRGVMPCQ